MTPESAHQLLNHAFERLTTPRDTANALQNFERLLPIGVERAYTTILSGVFSAAVLADHQHRLFSPEHYFRLELWSGFSDYNNWLPTPQILQLLFPAADAALHQNLQQQVAMGHFDHNDLLYAWATLPPAQEQSPTSEFFLQHLLSHPHVRAAGLLSLPDLQLAKLHPEDQQWLIGIYTAAFNRAPDPQGLQYWAQRHVEMQEMGLEHHEIIRLLARDMTWSGERHQEQGTTLGHEAFVHYYYHQVLGREADPTGAEYWTQALLSGELPRSEFIAVFLNSALLNPGDGAVVRARIAVAAAATALEQQHPGQVDLSARLQEVHNPATALAVIEQLQAQIQELQAQIQEDTRSVTISSHDTDALQHGLDSPPPFNNAETETFLITHEPDEAPSLLWRPVMASSVPQTASDAPELTFTSESSFAPDTLSTLASAFAPDTVFATDAVSASDAVAAPDAVFAPGSISTLNSVLAPAPDASWQQEFWIF